VGSVPLLDRVAERARIGELLNAAEDGHSAVLAISGEAGVGKTALLDYAVESANRLRVASVAGVQSEMELTFAGLQQLLAPMLDLAGRLPEPQRDALDVAFGLKAGPTPDRFLVGLAALSLLSEAAADRPLLCVVDDAQWLDKASAQVLGFVARRLLAEPIALLFAMTGLPCEGLVRLPQLAVGGLATRDARALLASTTRLPLDAPVVDRVVAETRGNPLALQEMWRSLSLGQSSGGFGVPETPALSARIEDGFRRRLEALPADSQRLVLLAAAEPTGDPALLWRAARLLGIGTQAQDAAQDAGLIQIGDRVTFRHPLVRSAVYRSASPQQRRAANAALAEATDPVADPERRAWHRAQAALGPDEDVAAELERLAGHARARAGYCAAAAFLQRSAELTVDTGQRAERTLAAAYARYEAGAYDVAERLVAAAQAGPLDDLQRARLDLLYARIAFACTRSSDAPSLFLKAARELEPIDMRLARETYLEALSAARFAGSLATGGDQVEVAQAIRGLPPAPEPARATDLLMDGLALLITEGYPAGVPALKRAISAFRSPDLPDEEALRWWQAPDVAVLASDYESWDVLSARVLSLAHGVGALTDLPAVLTSRAGVHMLAGEFAEAGALVTQLHTVSDATNCTMTPYAAIALAALQGREAEAFALIAAATNDAERRGEGRALTFFQWATAVLCNGLGRYEEALAAARRAIDDPARTFYTGFTGWSLAELIEAAARSARPECAAGALRRLTENARSAGTDWALGIEARSRALVSRGNVAERCYRDAIERLGRTPLKVELARSRLVYGEWLRRQRRRRDARDELRAAYEAFESIGAAAFAGRARGELDATGEHARKRTFEAGEPLTAQETLVASHAGGGASNRQIAEQLFISPATVAYHLRKAFTKLGVGSRHELAAALAGQPVPPPALPRF
jgi:DNA-binding CsgD family transcriptional regulator